MRIEFENVTLCTGVGIDSPEEFFYEGQEDEQVSKFLRAASAIIRQRYNETTHLDFTVCRSHGTIQAAEKYCLTFRQASTLPHYGTLVLKTDDGSGTNVTALYLPNAHFARGKVKFKGMLSWTSYSFSGGAMQTNSP